MGIWQMGHSVDKELAGCNCFILEDSIKWNIEKKFFTAREILHYEFLTMSEVAFSSNYSQKTLMLELKTAQSKLWHEGLLHPLQFLQMQELMASETESIFLLNMLRNPKHIC